MVYAYDGHAYVGADGAGELSLCGLQCEWQRVSVVDRSGFDAAEDIRDR